MGCDGRVSGSLGPQSLHEIAPRTELPNARVDQWSISITNPI